MTYNLGWREYKKFIGSTERLIFYVVINRKKAAKIIEDR
jgi:hypothetical protein